jgi:hypothetical protein
MGRYHPPLWKGIDCPKCGRKAGDPGFLHTCLWCHAKRKALVPAKASPGFGLPAAWLVVSGAEIAERRDAGGWADSVFDKAQVK